MSLKRVFTILFLAAVLSLVLVLLPGLRLENNDLPESIKALRDCRQEEKLGKKLSACIDEKLNRRPLIQQSADKASME